MGNERLARLWHAIEVGDPIEHTSIVVPSLSFDAEELMKISGAPRYEERLLFTLMRLRDPRARVIYVTSQALHPEIVDYYLGLLVGVSPRSARARLQLFCCYDGSIRPLTEKILERPRLIERIRQAMGDPNHTYLTCFNSTHLEERLAFELGIPLNGCDPALLDLGGKSGSREVFRTAGVPLPDGRERLHSVEQVIDALDAIWKPGLERAVVKLDQGFAGAGNALFTYPATRPDTREARETALREALDGLEILGTSSVDTFLAKLASMGGIVEEMVTGNELLSPSVQMRLTPTGDLEVVSTHDQILGGSTGQSYSGCRFPADSAYRNVILEHAMAIGEELKQRGVVSRFAIDFIVCHDGDIWRAWAIEINLRMGGTTIPFLALQFLTGGSLDPENGDFVTPSGIKKFYRATDSLYSPSYHGLLPEDLMDILDTHGLGFSSERKTGILFHMVGALSEHGKVGVTAIGNSRTEADLLFQQTIDVLDSATGNGGMAGSQAPDLPAPTVPVRGTRLPME